jgi:hypothetical protein
MAFAHVFLLITVGFFVVLPRLLERRPEWAAYLRLLNAPVLHPLAGQVYGFGLLVWIIVGLRFGTLGFSPFSLWGYYTQMDDEIFEFFAAYAFLTFSAVDLAYRVAEARLVAARGPMKAGALGGARGKAFGEAVRQHHERDVDALDAALSPAPVPEDDNGGPREAPAPPVPPRPTASHSRLVVR